MPRMLLCNPQKKLVRRHVHHRHPHAFHSHLSVVREPSNTLCPVVGTVSIELGFPPSFPNPGLDHCANLVFFFVISFLVFSYSLKSNNGLKEWLCSGLNFSYTSSPNNEIWQSRLELEPNPYSKNKSGTEKRNEKKKSRKKNNNKTTKR